MNELVTVRNTLNGGVAKVRRNIAEHPIFGEHLEIVPDGTKPFKTLAQLNPEPLAPVVDEVSEYDLEEEED